MSSRVVAVAGLLVMAGYVLFLAVRIASPPLLVITILVVAMAALDVWREALRGNGQ